MEVPLHVAAHSLLRNLAPGVKPNFYMLLTGFSAAGRDLLRCTLDHLDRDYSLSFLPEESVASQFQGFHTLLGSHAPYHRLLLPDLIDEPRFLYLDSDTLTLIDVSPLFAMDMGSYAAGFVVDGTVKYALESRFFQSLGKDPDGPAFNSGVILMQREQWIQQDCWPRIRAFCERYSDQLLAADQTALNALMAENCFHLPPQFNTKLFPKRSTRIGDTPGIFHFVGSPKPWDMLGRATLPYSVQWFDELDRTPLPASKKQLWRSKGYWQRLPRLLGSYRRLIKSALA
jgi:lipopolysaccharide biosynthesis glycosyltransferase